MLLHLSGTASAAHSDILQCTAKAGCFMTLKMAQTDKNICIHDCVSDVCSLAVLAIYNRNFYLICSANSIRNNNLTTGRNCIKSIQVRTVEMLQRIFPASRIQCIAVGKKWLATLLLTQICDYLRVVRPQERHVAKLSEMHLDRNKFSVHIDVFDACRNTEFSELIKLARADRAAKIGKING